MYKSGLDISISLGTLTLPFMFLSKYEIEFLISIILDLSIMFLFYLQSNHPILIYEKSTLIKVLFTQRIHQRNHHHRCFLFHS